MVLMLAEHAKVDRHGKMYDMGCGMFCRNFDYIISVTVLNYFLLF